MDRSARPRGRTKSLATLLVALLVAAATLPLSPSASGAQSGRSAALERLWGLDRYDWQTLLKLLATNGIDCTVHGFRSSFKTWVIEATTTPWAVGEAAACSFLV